MKADDAEWAHTYRARAIRCSAGRADRPKTGKPVVLMKLAFENQKDVPLMISLATARLMLVDFVYILNHFNDPLANRLKLLHFREQ